MFCNSLQQLKFLLHAKQNLFFIFIQIFLTTLFLYSQHWKIFAKIQKISWNILCVIKFSNFTCFQLKTNTKETESTLKSAHHMLPPVDYLIIHWWNVEGGSLWSLLQKYHNIFEIHLLVHLYFLGFNPCILNIYSLISCSVFQNVHAQYFKMFMLCI